MRDKIKQVLASGLNSLLGITFNEFKPIVIVGDVGVNYAKIFIANKDRKEDDIKIPHTYNVIRKKIALDNTKYCAILLTINGLNSNTKYNIPIKINSEIIEVEFKTNFDNNSSINFLMGSCNLHSINIVKSSFNTFKTLDDLRRKNDVDFMLHLGDQIYSDIPAPFFHPTLEYYCDKYFSAWSKCDSTNKFLYKLSNYMILDDHEIINNYRNRGDREKYKYGLDAYEVFQLSHSPRIDTQFHYEFTKGIFDFFVLDTRTTRDTKNGLIICKDQETALYNWLLKNKDNKTFKFIATAVPFLVDMIDTENDKWCSKDFVNQRNRIVDFITIHNIKNVIFLSGDVHCSLMSKCNLSQISGKESLEIHEITSSPLNQLQFSNINTFIRKHKIATEFSIGDVNTYLYYDSSSNACLIKATDSTLNVEFFQTSTGKLVKSHIINLKS